MKKTDNDDLRWNAFLAGDDQEYESIYKDHVQALYTYGLTLTTDEELVKDCIHDVFVRIYENRKNLGQTDNIRSYLVSALKNSLLMIFRKQNTYLKYQNEVGFEKGWIESETALDQLIDKEEEDKRQLIIDNIWTILTPRQKEIVYQRYVTGLSIEAIAQQENIDYHSVANIIQRAIKKIRKFYALSD